MYWFPPYSSGLMPSNLVGYPKRGVKIIKKIKKYGMWFLFFILLTPM